MRREMVKKAAPQDSVVPAQSDAPLASDPVTQAAPQGGVAVDDDLGPGIGQARLGQARAPQKAAVVVPQPGGVSAPLTSVAMQTPTAPQPQPPTPQPSGEAEAGAEAGEAPPSAEQLIQQTVARAVEEATATLRAEYDQQVRTIQSAKDREVVEHQQKAYQAEQARRAIEAEKARLEAQAQQWELQQQQQIQAWLADPRVPDEEKNTWKAQQLQAQYQQLQEENVIYRAAAEAQRKYGVPWQDMDLSSRTALEYSVRRVLDHQDYQQNIAPTMQWVKELLLGKGKATQAQVAALESGQMTVQQFAAAVGPPKPVSRPRAPAAAEAAESPADQATPGHIAGGAPPTNEHEQIMQLLQRGDVASVQKAKRMMQQRGRLQGLETPL